MIKKSLGSKSSEIVKVPFPITYVKSALGMKLTDEEIEDRRIQLEKWLKEVFKKLYLVKQSTSANIVEIKLIQKEFASLVFFPVYFLSPKFKISPFPRPLFKYVSVSDYRH